MAARVIVDTGVLVALLNGDDELNEWATSLVPSLKGPWLTAEACISETLFLIEHAGREAAEELFRWLSIGALISEHFLPEQLESLRDEILRYQDRWVDFADACVVLLSDRNPKLPVVTIDARDFAVYFRHRPRRHLILPD